jgi:hypothetical protein
MDLEEDGGCLVEVLSRHSHWKLRKSMENLGYLVFRPKFELSTSRLSVSSFTAKQTRSAMALSNFN